MDKVTAGRVIAGNLSAVGKLPADSHLAETVVGSLLHPAEMAVGVVGRIAGHHKVAYLMRMNSQHTVYCLCPGWDIGFVEWDHPVPDMDIDS